jgi:hypothetical protein
MDIQTEHMKRRCYFISTMCSMSLYSWYNYSLFDPIDNSFITPYYQNGLLFLFYLGWDTYHMITKPILFRTDLIIHHIMSFIITTSSINNNTLQMSNYMIIECISLMNYIWRNDPQLLKSYRTLCILSIRSPLSLWFYFYYTPTIMYPHWKYTLTYNHYLYLKLIYDMSIFFMFYDIFILWKLYKPKKLKQ